MSAMVIVKLLFMNLLTWSIASFLTLRSCLYIFAFYPIAWKYHLLYSYGRGKSDHFLSTFSFSLFSGATSSPAEPCKLGPLSLTFQNNRITCEHGGRLWIWAGKVFTVTHSQPQHSISNIAAYSASHHKKASANYAQSKQKQNQSTNKQ